jgi:hypothetical protein
MAINSNEEKHENQPIGYKVYSDLSHKTLLQSDTLYKVYISTIIFFNLINLVHTSKISYLFPTPFFYVKSCWRSLLLFLLGIN